MCICGSAAAAVVVVGMIVGIFQGTDVYAGACNDAVASLVVVVVVAALVVIRCASLSHFLVTHRCSLPFAMVWRTARAKKSKSLVSHQSIFPLRHLLDSCEHHGQDNTSTFVQNGNIVFGRIDQYLFKI